MTKEEYIAHCRKEIAATFEAKKRGKPDDKLKYRTEGLIQAAKLLGFINKAEIYALIEEEHQIVFGESVATRRAREKSMTALKESSPDAYFDIPAITRKLY